MVASFYGNTYAVDYLRSLINITRQGANIQDIAQGAETIGFKTLIVKTTVKYLKEAKPLPSILFWNQKHFVVLYEISKDGQFLVADPASGKYKLNESEFLAHWNQHNQSGIALLMEPSAHFYTEFDPQNFDRNSIDISYLKNLFSGQQSRILMISACLLASVAIAAILPVSTRWLIDQGLGKKSVNIVFVALVFQLAMSIGEFTFEWIRSIVSVHLSMNVTIRISKLFLNKLIMLPIKFFDTKTHSDIYQRIEDQNKIQNFLTTRLINYTFSFALLVVFTVQLIIINMSVFMIFFILSLLSIVWVFFFYDRRSVINYKKFGLSSTNRNNVLELIGGMSEIKLNGAQQVKISVWENIQNSLYKLEVKGLKLSQYQNIGVNGLSQIKGLLITGFCALEVLHSNMTIGTMISIGYIVGQLKAPIEQFVDLVWSGQDAKIAFDRLEEIQKKSNEEQPGQLLVSAKDQHIYLNNVYFKYEGSLSPFVLKDITFKIPAGKITAIVGASGSGKTTLLKLLLKFHDPSTGEIKLGQNNFSCISPDDWRRQCGVVLQDGFIFSGTIAENIAIASDELDIDRLKYAAEMACLFNFIESLPLGFNTKIGKSGTDLSGGQKQRILIARAIYKDPNYIFFDEATSSLDTINETKIIANLNKFFCGRTVVLIAHRLSTVKGADQVLVFKDHSIVEFGTHLSLINKKGYYFNLIKNQLELGN